ncbi:hypothetical protein LCGC14_1242390 [marine sediment metagenome]|uniref:Uncharacterized protein n=1 Tax=marine sediment metagenome TaxID=412755 RepID=A0A0F9L9J3_9ZZZZ
MDSDVLSKVIQSTKRDKRKRIDEGYQYIKLEFFKLCQDRDIKGNTMLLLIFLRGLYCYLQRPTFNLSNKFIIDKLGFALNSLRKARQELKHKGILLYQEFHGRGKETQYTMLGTTLLPALKGSKISLKGAEIEPLVCAQKVQKLNPLYKELIRVNKELDTYTQSQPKNWKKDTMRDLETMQN